MYVIKIGCFVKENSGWGGDGWGKGWLIRSSFVREVWWSSISLLPFQDIDTIYLAHDCKELRLADFDHLDAKWAYYLAYIMSVQT